MLWIPAFAKMTFRKTFYEIIKKDELHFFPRQHNHKTSLSATLPQQVYLVACIVSGIEIGLINCKILRDS